MDGGTRIVVSTDNGPFTPFFLAQNRNHWSGSSEREVNVCLVYLTRAGYLRMRSAIMLFGGVLVVVSISGLC
jgi:hypothetical protein